MNISEAKDAIHDFSNDRNRTPRQAIDGLEELRDEIDMLIDALRCDVKNTGEEE